MFRNRKKVERTKEKKARDIHSRKKPQLFLWESQGEVISPRKINKHKYEKEKTENLQYFVVKNVKVEE